METLAPTITRHVLIDVASCRPTEFIDITDTIAALATAARLDVGFVNIQTRHTTTAIVVNEHEPLLLEDFVGQLEAIVPSGRPYRHDNMAQREVNLTPEERINGHAHCRALFLPASACLNVVGGELQLGRWQRVFVAELDGPRAREVSLLFTGEGRA